MNEQPSVENDALAREALADYLTRKVGPARLPIGTRVAVRSFKGAVGTVVGPDGYPKGSALAVRMDRPYPKGFRDGYACVDSGECSVIDAPDEIEAEFGVTVCADCGEQRWAGTGPCSSCPIPPAKGER